LYNIHTKNIWTFLKIILIFRTHLSILNIINNLLSSYLLINRRNKNVKFNTTNARKDDFDDLLSDLMSKEEMKKSRKNIEPYSSQNLGLASNDPFTKTT